MAMKTRSMRLDDEDWKELKRVGSLGRMDRSRLMREFVTHVTPRIQTKEDLQRLLAGFAAAPQPTRTPARHQKKSV